MNDQKRINILVEEVIISNRIIYTEAVRPINPMLDKFIAQEKRFILPVQYYDKSLTKFENILKYTMQNQPQRDSKENMVIQIRTIGVDYGCEHYIGKTLVKCNVCQKQYSCHKCHDEQEDHKFAFGALVCQFCNHEQDITKSLYQCQKCNIQLCNYYCIQCNIFCFISMQATPYYHCQYCNKCELGIEKYKKHCNKCKKCFNIFNFEKHRCLIEDEICPICQLSLNDENSEGKEILPCMHALHPSCKLLMLQHNNFKCPTCRILVLRDQSRTQFEAFMENKYLQEIVPPIWENKYVIVICNECSNKFVAQLNMVGYRCTNPKCLTFNTTQQSSFVGSAEEAQAIVKQQNDILVANGKNVLEPIFNDLEFYQRFFVYKFEKEISCNIKQDESMFQCLLRLLDLDTKPLEMQLILLNKLLLQYQEGMLIKQAKLLIWFNFLEA